VSRPGAKAQLGDVKPAAQPRGQVVARKEYVPRLGQPVLQAEIRIVKAGRDRHIAVAPNDPRLLILHWAIPR
jgi:hypothetical protein